MYVFITRRSLSVISSLIRCRTAHLSPLSTFIPNYNMLGAHLMQASLEESVNINTSIIPLNFKSRHYCTASRPCWSFVMHTFCLRLPLNTFHGINLSLSHSLSHFASVSLSLGRDVMSLIAARWRGARKNRINLVSPEPSLFPLLYPMHQLKLSRRGPLVSAGSVRYTKRGRRERYSREGNRWDLQRGKKGEGWMREEDRKKQDNEPRKDGQRRGR